MSEKTERLAAFGQGLDARFWCPSSGTCLSAFVLVKKEDKVLLGKIAQPQLWIERWAFPPNIVKRPDVFRWLIPACHLRYGEHPDGAAKRIMEEMLQLSSYSLRFVECQSHLSESGHWDICFIYEAHTDQEIETPAWYSDLTFKSPKEMKAEDFGRHHDDILNYHVGEGQGTIRG